MEGENGGDLCHLVMCRFRSAMEDLEIYCIGDGRLWESFSAVEERNDCHYDSYPKVITDKLHRFLICCMYVYPHHQSFPAEPPRQL